MKIKVITETDRTDFQEIVNDFLEQPVKILDVTFSTTFIGEGYLNKVEYVAFIEYKDRRYK